MSTLTASPAARKVNCVEWSLATLRDPHAPADHHAIARDLLNDDTTGAAFREFVPPAIEPVPAPMPKLGQCAAWYTLPAVERNRRTELAAAILYPSDPIEFLGSRRLGFASWTAERLTGDPDRTDVPAHVRKAFAAAIAPASVLPTFDPNAAKGTFTTGLNRAETNIVMTAFNRTLDVVSRAGGSIEVRRQVATVAARAALQAVLAARPVVVVEWSPVAPRVACPSCNDVPAGCPDCTPFDDFPAVKYAAPYRRGTHTPCPAECRDLPPEAPEQERRGAWVGHPAFEE